MCAKKSGEVATKVTYINADAYANMIDNKNNMRTSPNFAGWAGSHITSQYLGNITKYM